MEIFKKLGIKKVINAVSTFTYLGGSIMPIEAAQAYVEASQCFVNMEELMERAGGIIAKITGAEAGLVVSGASAGITLGVSACMAEKDGVKQLQLPNTVGMKDKVIIQKTHRTIYDNCARLSGAELVEIGTEDGTTREQLENAIKYRTACIFHIARHEKEGLPLKEICAIAHKNSIPVLVDAAAELPPRSNLVNSIYIKRGADLVTISGGKGLCGPNATGLLFGRKNLIEAASGMSLIGMYKDLYTRKDWDYTNIKALIGRPMKVDKGQIAALITALQIYIAGNDEDDFNDWDKKVSYMVGSLKDTPNISVKRVIGDGTNLLVPYCEVSIDEKGLGMTASDVHYLLREGDPPIWVSRTPQRSGIENRHKLFINARLLKDGEEKIIVERLKEIVVKKE